MSCFIWSNFLFKFIILSSKSVFLTKAAISFLFTKFACAILEVKISAVNLLNYWVVIYLSWLVVILFSVSLIFVL